MTTKFKFAVAALVAFVPAASMAQESVAVALGASFQPIEKTYSGDWSMEADGSVEIPALSGTGEVVDGCSIFGCDIDPLSFETEAETAVLEADVSGDYSFTRTNMELTSISIAAAAGEIAVASAVANGNGNTGANAGASDSNRDDASATIGFSPTWGGGNYTSEVLID